ncbi:hypothetical protein [Staphylococcus equorum]|uniref:Uncharacterized protein n=1 Tax=Staphylococcus equorum TaxID=246432 RepID=A0AAP7LV30_9STAP|nr:hypothetical protein [Staphylococcus equorum]OEK59099.1 hypothetical protein ASS94_00095 [Staphylococcus equorum]
MKQWSREALEKHYESNLTENDCQVVRQELEGMAWQEVESDTRLYKDIKTYGAYVYDDWEACSRFITLLTDLALEEPNTKYTVKELLLGDEAVELDEGKLLFIMG